MTSLLVWLFACKRHKSDDAIFAHFIGAFHFAILLQYPILLFFAVECLYLLSITKMKNILYYEKEIF